MKTRNGASRSRARRSRTKSGAPPAVAKSSRLRTPTADRPASPDTANSLRIFLVPCSCGTTFSVAEDYDHQGTAWSRYLTCPTCKKRHDPENRLLQMGFRSEGYWAVDDC